MECFSGGFECPYWSAAVMNRKRAKNTLIHLLCMSILNQQPILFTLKDPFSVLQIVARKEMWGGIEFQIDFYRTF